MISSIALALAQNVVLGWFWRRAQELAAWAFGLVPIYLAMPPAMQEDVRAILTGQGGGLSISAAVGIVWYLWTQLQSYRATTRPQLVTVDAKKIPLPAKGQEGASVTREAETVAKTAPKPKTLWDMLTKR